MTNRVPWTTVAVACAVIAAVTVLIIEGDGNSGVITVLVGLLPAMLVGAGYAERNSRDIRNGTVVEKAKQGATQALQETGVTAVAQTANESTTLAMRALSTLLEKEQGKVVPPNGGQTV